MMEKRTLRYSPEATETMWFMPATGAVPSGVAPGETVTLPADRAEWLLEHRDDFAPVEAEKKPRTKRSDDDKPNEGVEDTEAS